MRTAALWVAVFAITVLEVWISTWEGRADRQSTSAKHNRFSIKAGIWAGAFEIVLLLDIWLIVREGFGVGIPIVAGAVWAKYHALEKRRAKFRARVKRKRGTSGTPVEPATDPTSLPSSTSASNP